MVTDGDDRDRLVIVLMPGRELRDLAQQVSLSVPIAHPGSPGDHGDLRALARGRNDMVSPTRLLAARQLAAQIRDACREQSNPDYFRRTRGGQANRTPVLDASALFVDPEDSLRMICQIRAEQGRDADTLVQMLDCLLEQMRSTTAQARR